MDPVVRGDHNFVYHGPTEEVGDLPCYRDPAVCRSHWKPTTEELEALNQGAHVELSLYMGDDIPPVGLAVVEQKPPPGEKAKIIQLDDHR